MVLPSNRANAITVSTTFSEGKMNYLMWHLRQTFRLAGAVIMFGAVAVGMCIATIPDFGNEVNWIGLLAIVLLIGAAAAMYKILRRKFDGGASAMLGSLGGVITAMFVADRLHDCLKLDISDFSWSKFLMIYNPHDLWWWYGPWDLGVSCFWLAIVALFIGGIGRSVFARPLEH